MNSLPRRAVEERTREIDSGLDVVSLNSARGDQCQHREPGFYKWSFLIPGFFILPRLKDSLPIRRLRVNRYRDSSGPWEGLGIMLRKW